MIEQQRDVFLPVAQGRKSDLNGIDPVEQILPELPVSYYLMDGLLVAD